MTERWLFVNSAPAFGGHEMMLLRWLAELSRDSSVETLLLAPQGSRLRALGAAYATPEALPVRAQRSGSTLARIRRRLAGTAPDLAVLGRVVRRTQPTLCIFAQPWVLDAPALVMLARLLRMRTAVYVPLIDKPSDIGSSLGGLRDAIARLACPYLADLWITITQEQARTLRGWAGIRQPILTLPNAVDPRIESAGAELASPQRQPSNVQQVLVLGRLEPKQKGLDVLLDYLAGADHLCKRVNLTLVGEGPGRDEIDRRLAASALLRELVSVAPWADTSTVMRLYDVLLLPSRYEGVPLVMLEAMALRLPVVAADLPGTRAFLHGDDLFPPGDLARAFARIEQLREPSVRDAAIARNRAAFETRASGTAFARAVRELTACLAPDLHPERGAKAPLGRRGRRASPPLVSVYMPTRNRLAQLRSAVDSVLAQTYANVELIVTNDASTDGTRQYIEGLQRADRRVRLLHNDTRGGAPRARNRAIHLARGEFVTGLDDDDRFHPERIEALLDYWNDLAARGEQVSGVFTQDYFIRGGQVTCSRKPPIVQAEDLFFHNTIGNQIFTRRAYMLEAGLFDEQMPAWQDLDVLIRLLRRYGPARLLDRPLYYLSLDPHPARISRGSKNRILTAYSLLSAKSEPLPRVMRQGLYLQVFAPLYGFKLGPSDLREFFRLGLHRRTLKHCAGLLVRQMLLADHERRS